MNIVHKSIQYRGFLLLERYSTVEMNGRKIATAPFGKLYTEDRAQCDL